MLMLLLFQIFFDAYKSTLSVVVVDEIESLIGKTTLPYIFDANRVILSGHNNW